MTVKVCGCVMKLVQLLHGFIYQTAHCCKLAQSIKFAGIYGIPLQLYMLLWWGLCGPGGRQVDHAPAVCPGCQEGQWDPGMHQEESGQQVEEVSPPPLLSSSEAPSGVLCPVLGSPVHER